MWLVNFVFVAVVVCFLQTCHGDVQVNGQRVESRFLGTLNRYYAYSWERSNGTEYIDLANTENAIRDLGLGDEEEGGDEGSGESGEVGLVQGDELDNTKDFVIVIHGRKDSAFGNFGQTLKTSFVSSDHDLVVIVVDWALIANRDYTDAVNAASFIAGDIRTLIIHLQAAIKTVHIIGFDIGAHIAGIISRHSSVNVQRITGLSPASQNWGATSQRLRPTDAEYVEVVHTDYTGARAFGIGVTIGTVDMYANSGTSQPGCSNNQCNHDRAWQLFAASLDFGGHLVGLGCNNITDMTRNRCANPPGVILGTNTLSKRGTGIYRVNTGRAYPYNV